LPWVHRACPSPTLDKIKASEGKLPFDAEGVKSRHSIASSMTWTWTWTRTSSWTWTIWTCCQECAASEEVHVYVQVQVQDKVEAQVVIAVVSVGCIPVVVPRPSVNTSKLSESDRVNRHGM